MFGILDRHGDRVILLSPPLHVSVFEEKISMMLQPGSFC
ncbi:hypothetical protein KOPIIPEJ_00201 [Aeromonas dhakensis]|nr:Uncharacterised protein [Aeromonas hydrophila]